MIRLLGRFRLVCLACLVWATIVLPSARTAAADPLDPREVPEALKPWTAWALDGKADALCPVLLGHADLSRCAWPSRLDLTIEAGGGRFVQRWHVDVARPVPLPGDDKRWPTDVKVDGARAVVVPLAGGPSVTLPSGDHAVEGTFAWDSPPESLKVPEETGLLGLTLRGAPVAWPNRDAHGTVWLQKAATNEEGDALEVVVHRKVTDDIPMVLTTRVELHVAGKSREELLGRALPAGFVPMALTGSLPARVEPDGRLRVQVRPGIYVLELVARSERVVTSLARPAPGGPWRDGEEVWAFEARSDYRIVTVTGVSSIDPQQTTLPDAWKRLPAYPMKLGATLVLEEKRRGDADPPPDQLTLARTLWLDFDGTGYTASDRLSGTLQRDTRLTMAAPTVLGRVAIEGRDQFITRLAGSPLSGVEVRQGELSASADSRIAGDPTDLPAVGWAHDFRQVSADLHLPPGWRLLHASGVDEVDGTWVKRWTLLELFLALMVAIGIGRLYGHGWGAVAAALLFLTMPEEDAPKWSWLFVLAAEALVRVLPAGTARKVFEGARLAAVAIVALIAVPFLVQHVREGLFPALASESSVESTSLSTLSPREQEADVPAEPQRAKADEGRMGGGAGAPPAPPAQAAPGAPSARAAAGMLSKSSIDYRQSNGQLYDPNAMVQTGPGLPRWQWSTLALRWSGPVAAAQRLHLYLLSPDMNLALALVRAGLLIVMILRLLPWAGGRPPGGAGQGRAAAAAVAMAMTLAPVAAKADIPDEPTLQELATRLTRRPDCTPGCASASRMAVEVRSASLSARIEVDARAPTAVPLPGASAEWAPSKVLLDAQPARALLRTDDGVLWIELAAGVHTIALEGPLPDRESVQLALRMKPHRVEVSAEGWSVAGVHEDGLADDDLELTRTRRSGDAGALLEQGALPSFVRVERTLHAGLDWQVDTRVLRVTPPGVAVVLEVPLLAGESVTTADVRVEGGKALLNLAAQATEAGWHSVLDQKSPVSLVAPKAVSWVEVWRVDVGPIWHATFAGIPAVHAQAGASVPEWHPWPGEQLTIDLVRPDGAPGQTLTIDESSAEVRPGQRATDVTLTLHLRSSRGGEHTVVLPPDAQLESLTLNGATQPIRQQGERVTLPIAPGAQTAVLAWREGRGLSSVFRSGAIDLGEQSVNARLSIAVPGTQWLLFAGGPRVGPAVLFWSLLLVLLVVSLVLGVNRWTPLRWWHWLLLSIGLSQVSVVAGAVFVAWLLALGWRARLPEGRGPRLYNLVQVALVLLTVSALGVLAVSLYQGLLGSPEMQVRGNGSSASLLQWFTDRSAPSLPTAWMVSVPILVYRGAMLAWALWSALALLGWLRWGWGAFTEGGAWRKVRPRPRPRMPPMAPAPPAAPPPPEQAPPAG